MARLLTAKRFVAAVTSKRLISRALVTPSIEYTGRTVPRHVVQAQKKLLTTRTTGSNDALMLRSFCSATGNPDDSALSSMEKQNDILQQYAKQGNVLQAEQVLLLMQRQRGEAGDNVYPDAQAYSAVLRAWLSSDQDQELDKEMHDASQNYKGVDRATEVLFQWREAASKSGFLLSPPSTTGDYQMILEAWTEIAHVKGVPQRAQYILELLEKDSDESLNLVTVESYNEVLKCWARSAEHLRGTMAQTLFTKLQEYEHQPSVLPKNKLQSNGTSYRTMIHAWVHSGESKAAFRATGHLMKLLRLLEQSFEREEGGGGSDDLQPTMEDYSKIFKAWTTAKDKHASEKSLSVLGLMEYAYIHRFSELRADLEMYRSILQAYARSDASPQLGPDIEQVLEKMGDRYLVPDTDCFASAIQTYANCALHKDLAPDEQNRDPAWPLAQRAHILFEEMGRAVHKTEAVQISTEHYNIVLKAYTAVVAHDAAEPALKLLGQMEGSTETRPNAATYALVVTIISKSAFVKNKVEQSQALINRAELEYERDPTNEAAKPNVFLYNALIRTCASAASNRLSEVEQEETFRLALTTMQKKMKGSGATVRPDSETFLFLLDASAALLPTPSAMQNRAMEQIFHTACTAGLIDHVLLSRFRDVAPPALHAKLVLEAAEQEDDGTRVVPLAWSANVTTKGLIVDRKKAPALTVDGQFFLTSKMKDHRMRRLRRRRNQRLLQGGRRWQQELDEEYRDFEEPSQETTFVVDGS
jgi:hypothetical protein